MKSFLTEYFLYLKKILFIIYFDMLKLLITFLLIIVARYGHSQENAYFYANNGEKISVVLPNGYCDIKKR